MQLAETAGAALLRVDLAETQAGWAFLGADPLPHDLPPIVMSALLGWLAGAG